MGRNSQQRRQQKLRREQQRQRDAFSRRPAGASTTPPLDDLVQLACAAAHGPMADKRQFTTVMAVLHRMEADEADPLDRPSSYLHRRIGSATALVFEHGWHPADVAHAAKRAFTQRVGRLAAQYAAAHAREHNAVHRAPPLWLEQLADLGVLEPAADQIVGGQADLLARWAKTEKLHPDDALDGAVQLLALLLRTRRQPQLLPPPSAWAATNSGSAYARAAAAGGEVDAKMLRTIRALLAKAEATTFEAEADAFTAKAQELMARYSIDAAVLAAAVVGDGGRVARGTEARRVHIDDPYADEKVSLLANIGHANGVRCVWSSESGFATAVGYPVDLQLTEVLYTSLLVQATRAAAHATEARADLRTPSFRRAFLMAFAERIGERLEAATRHVTEEAEHEYGSSLLPALAHRQAEVDATYDELFPGAVPMRQRRLNAAGYYAGRAAGDRADIGAGKPLPRG